MKKVYLAIAFLLVLGLALGSFGCAQPEEPTTPVTPAPSEKFINIGSSGALSGPAAGWGIPYARALEILVDEANEAGGIDIAGEKYTIKLFVYDDKGESAEAGVVARKLVEDDKVLMVIYHGGNSPAVTYDFLKAEGILQCGMPFDTTYPDADHPLAFGTFMRYPEVMSASYAWLGENYPEAKRVAQMSPDNVSGHGSKQIIEEHTAELGIDLLSVDLYPLDTADFTPILTKVLATEPDLISVCASPPKCCGLIVKQARELGYEGLFMHYQGTDLGVVNEIAGPENAEGFIGVDCIGEPLLPAEAKFIETYAARYGSPVPDFAVLSYGSLQIFVEALKQSPSTKPEDIANTLRTGRFDTMWGESYCVGKEYYGIDSQPVRDVSVSVPKGGKIVRVGMIPWAGY